MCGLTALLGTDYVDPRTTNRILRGSLNSKPINDANIMEGCTPFGHSDWQGIKAEDIPSVAFSVGEEELAGIGTRPLVGQLAAWNHFMSVRSPANTELVAGWHRFIGNPRRHRLRPAGPRNLPFPDRAREHRDGARRRAARILLARRHLRPLPHPQGFPAPA